MQKIKCPKCGEIFTIDEAGYAEIIRQVRDSEFSREIKDRMVQFDREKAQALELASAKAHKALLEAVAEKEKSLSDELSDKERRIVELSAKVEGSARDAELAVSEAVAAVEKKYVEENAARERIYAEERAAREKAYSEASAAKEREYSEALNAKSLEITELKGLVQASDMDKQLAVQKIESDYIAKLTAKNAELDAKQEEVEFYKDFKARQSTKMVGEDLERFCENEFNKIRATAFPRAYFEKDNDASQGSKGDFIYRETDESGVEILSIMFEMKNEGDETATKHKNDDFLKKLNDDRDKKKCEYAVLVSMLEPDSDLYNEGIVDKSYRFPKMYVVRPQLFIPMITILRNAAMNALDAKRELAFVRNQNIDITNFENSLIEFKAAAGRNYELAGRHFRDAIDNIDKTIKTLNKIKESLEKSVNNLRIANNKADELTIKKLTRGNDTMSALFAEAAAERGGEPGEEFDTGASGNLK